MNSPLNGKLKGRKIIVLAGWWRQRNPTKKSNFLTQGVAHRSGASGMQETMECAFCWQLVQFLTSAHFSRKLCGWPWWPTTVEAIPVDGCGWVACDDDDVGQWRPVSLPGTRWWKKSLRGTGCLLATPFSGLFPKSKSSNVTHNARAPSGEGKFRGECRERTGQSVGLNVCHFHPLCLFGQKTWWLTTLRTLAAGRCGHQTGRTSDSLLFSRATNGDLMTQCWSVCKLCSATCFKQQCFPQQSEHSRNRSLLSHFVFWPICFGAEHAARLMHSGCPVRSRMPLRASNTYFTSKQNKRILEMELSGWDDTLKMCWGSQGEASFSLQTAKLTKQVFKRLHFSCNQHSGMSLWCNYFTYKNM